MRGVFCALICSCLSSSSFVEMDAIRFKDHVRMSVFSSLMVATLLTMRFSFAGCIAFNFWRSLSFSSRKYSFSSSRLAKSLSGSIKECPSSFRFLVIARLDEDSSAASASSDAMVRVWGYSVEVNDNDAMRVPQHTARHGENVDSFAPSSIVSLARVHGRTGAGYVCMYV